MRNWINQLSIRKKLIFYSYLIITPILLCISGIIFMKNYGNTMDQEIESCMKSVEAWRIISKNYRLISWN